MSTALARVFALVLVLADFALFMNCRGVRDLKPVHHHRGAECHEEHDARDEDRAGGTKASEKLCQHSTTSTAKGILLSPANPLPFGGRGAAGFSPRHVDY
jgi:hypothetical protein